MFSQQSDEIDQGIRRGASGSENRTDLAGRRNTLLRWVVMLPAAVIGGVSARATYLAFNYFGLSFIDDPPYLLIILFEEFLPEAVYGAAVVYCAARVAPSHKSVAGLALAGGVIMMAGASSSLYLVGYYEHQTLSVGYAVTQNFMYVVGSLIAVYLEFRPAAE